MPHTESSFAISFTSAEDIKEFHWLWGKNGLAELYLITTANRIERHEMKWVKEKQEGLRSCLPAEFIAEMQRGLKDDETLGKVFFAPATWKGSREHMQKCYTKAKTMAEAFGNPHL